jgi:hypothetical protein
MGIFIILTLPHISISKVAPAIKAYGGNVSMAPLLTIIGGVNFTPCTIIPWKRALVLSGTCTTIQNLSWGYEEKKSLSPLSEIEPRFLGCLLRRVVWREIEYDTKKAYNLITNAMLITSRWSLEFDFSELRQKCSVLHGSTGAYDLQNKRNWTRKRAVIQRLCFQNDSQKLFLY